MKNFAILLAVGLIGLSLANKGAAQVAWVTYYAPTAPVTTFYAPAPVAVTSYFAPTPVVAYRPVPVATTRFRPILGGTVTRIRTGYAPMVVTPAPVVIGF